MKAKTYKSTNGWTAPQSLSTFGIPVSNKHDIKYLGLEEFNFCKVLADFTFQTKHVAFIPSYSCCPRPFIEKLNLFHSNGRGLTVHYATLYDVEQLNISEIDALRSSLIASGFPNFVETNFDFQNNYQNLFQPALKIWQKNFNTNNIISPAHNPRFVLNIKFNSIEIFSQPKQVDWSNLKRARILYT